MSTKTNVNTIQKMLDALPSGQPVGKGVAMIEEDTGTITGTASVKLSYPAISIQSTRVVTSATGASVGTYLAGDSGVTPLLPPGGASTAVGIASLSKDGQTLTFPNTVTRVITKYVPLINTEALQADTAAPG